MRSNFREMAYFVLHDSPFFATFFLSKKRGELRPLLHLNVKEQSRLTTSIIPQTARFAKMGAQRTSLQKRRNSQLIQWLRWLVGGGIRCAVSMVRMVSKCCTASLRSRGVIGTLITFLSGMR